MITGTTARITAPWHPPGRGSRAGHRRKREAIGIAPASPLQLGCEVVTEAATQPSLTSSSRTRYHSFRASRTSSFVSPLDAGQDLDARPRPDRDIRLRRRDGEDLRRFRRRQVDGYGVGAGRCARQRDRRGPGALAAGRAVTGSGPEGGPRTRAWVGSHAVVQRESRSPWGGDSTPPVSC
jgi:hypothetical protein